MDERVFVVVGYNGAELLDIACVTSALKFANRLGAEPHYRAVLATPGRGDITCDSGLRLGAEAGLERFNEPLDTLLVSGGLGHEQAAASGPLVGHVRLATLARRVASVCTGSTVLVEAGLLTGRRATTHWRYAEQLAHRYPDVRVDPGPIFIRDGNVATSGGRLDQDLSTPALARLAGVSERHLSRLFLASVGETPAPYVRRVRAEAAAQLLGSTRLPLSAVARRSGFGCTESLRHAFLERYAMPPSRYRAGQHSGQP